ncbi:MAG: DUF4294 domain-containing protein [Bacteroidetes bacterium]|nr:DUF4294 domain-containing protein [Bacteroidota bacterium]
MSPAYIKISFVALFILIMNIIFCQNRGKYDTIRVPAIITVEGDTLPFQILPRLEVVSVRKLTVEQRKQRQEWTRLRNAVYITYPYAKAASKIMNEINQKLVGVTDRKERKRIIKTREKELRKEFADRLTNLSIYQGKVLMKLIYRETGNNCYEIIQEYKGGFTAALYQTIAILVGTNLKQNYNANSSDKDLEIIVKDVEKMYGYSKG